MWGAGHCLYCTEHQGGQAQRHHHTGLLRDASALHPVLLCPALTILCTNNTVHSVAMIVSWPLVAVCCLAPCNVVLLPLYPALPICLTLSLLSCLVLPCLVLP